MAKRKRRSWQEEVDNQNEVHSELQNDVEEVQEEVKESAKWFIKDNSTIYLKSFKVTPQDLEANQALADILIGLGLIDQLERK